LHRQLARGGQYQGTGALCGLSPLQLFEEGNEEAGRLAGSRFGHGHHIATLQNQGNRLPLDGSRHLVSPLGYSLDKLKTETHRLEATALLGFGLRLENVVAPATGAALVVQRGKPGYFICLLFALSISINFYICSKQYYILVFLPFSFVLTKKTRAVSFVFRYIDIFRN